ncbi:hypothetical protein [Dongia sp.]|uniref:hypothetical protein n=1 Tax=Dongia sp. TaxID=1977262 RepID=UPI003751B1C7
MTIQAIGAGAALNATAAPAARPGQAAERNDPTASTIIISRVTVTNPDGSTTTTVTYADGHTKIETTPPKFAAAEGEGRVTAVDILA